MEEGDEFLKQTRKKASKKNLAEWRIKIRNLLKMESTIWFGESAECGRTADKKF